MTRMLNNLFGWATTLLRILYLSITSPLFYSVNFRKYKGYGIKYLMTISLICSLLICISILKTTASLNQYFTYGTIVPELKNLDYVINQFPTLKYDGKKIVLDNYEPIIIKNTNNEQVVIIDPDNKSPYNIKSQIPFYISSDKLVINFVNARGEIIQSLPLYYQAIIGNDELNIDQIYIKSILAKNMNRAPNIITFFIFPMIGLLIFSTSIFLSLISIFIHFALFKEDCYT